MAVLRGFTGFLANPSLYTLSLTHQQHLQPWVFEAQSTYDNTIDKLKQWRSVLNCTVFSITRIPYPISPCLGGFSNKVWGQRIQVTPSKHW